MNVLLFGEAAGPESVVEAGKETSIEVKLEPE